MTPDGIAYIAESLAKISNTPVRLYRDGERVFYHAEMELAVDPLTLYENEVLGIEGRVAYYVTGDQSYYGIINTGELTLITGPLRDGEPGEHTYQRLGMRLGVPPAEMGRFVRSMYAIPIMPLNTTVQILCIMHYVMTEERLDPGDIIIRDINQEDLANQIAEEALADRAAPVQKNHMIHNSADVERSIQNLIRRGRVEELRAYLGNMPSFGYGTLAHDELRNTKNLFVVSATLQSRAAIAGGLPEDRALALSDRYINRCELMTSEQDIMDLGYHMALDYAERVARVRLGDEPSELTVSVANYVQDHLYEPLSTEKIAAALFVSRGYLSTTFKRETGMNLSDYLQVEKIREAKQLLRHTTLSLLTISTYLGYSSQSHFGAVFKRHVGMTPREYRTRR